MDRVIAGVEASAMDGEFNVDQLKLHQLKTEVRRNTFDLEQFRAAVRGNAFRVVSMRAGGAHFFIHGKLRDGTEISLCTSRRRRNRSFRNPTSALELLRSIGVTLVEVTMSGWHPDIADQWAIRRPDMAERLSRGHRVTKLTVGDSETAEAFEEWLAKADVSGSDCTEEDRPEPDF
jgi:hypothetical protein